MEIKTTKIDYSPRSQYIKNTGSGSGSVTSTSSTSNNNEVLEYVNKMFTFDVENQAIKANYNFFGVGEISAYGLGSTVSGGTGGFTDEGLLNFLTANGYNTSALTINYLISGGTAAALDTLNELSTALGNDPNFATTITNVIGTKWTQDDIKIANWDTAFTNNHVHANLSVISGITSTNVTNWNTAFTNNHTHANLSVLSGITSTNITTWNTAYSLTSHTHTFASLTSKPTTVSGYGITDTFKSDLGGVTDMFTSFKEVGLGIWATATTNRPSDYGTILDFNRKGTTWYHRLAFATTGDIFYYTGINTETLAYYGKLAFTSSTVAAATKLATTRTIWGQSFNGTGNVDGVFRALNDALPSGDAAFKILRFPSSPYGLIVRGYDDGLSSLQSQRETTTTEYFQLSLNPLGGNVLIGTTTNGVYKLDVNGTSRITGSLHLNSEGWLNLYNAANTSRISISHNSASSKLDIYNRTTSAYANVEAGYLTVDGITMKNNQSEKFIRSNAWGGAIRLRANSGAATDRGIQLGNVNNGLVFYSRLAIDGDSGNVMIGTTTDAGYKLDVNGTGRFVSNLISNGYMSANGIVYAGGGLVAYNNSSITGNLTVTGEVTAYSASDIRLKSDIQQLTSSLDIINKLNPVSYRWNDTAKSLNPNKNDGEDYGLIAQELEDVLPNLVHNVYNTYKSIDYVKLVPFLVASVKELHNKNIELERRIEELSK